MSELKKGDIEDNAYRDSLTENHEAHARDVEKLSKRKKLNKRGPVCFQGLCGEEAREKSEAMNVESTFEKGILKSTQKSL